MKLRVELIRPPKHVGIKTALGAEGLIDRYATFIGMVAPLTNLNDGISK